MANLSCPHCHQLINNQVITCPHCRITLKAYGHPGIPLHRSVGNEYLCESCVYHLDDSCNFPKRPDAKDCTLYQSHEEIQEDFEGFTKINSIQTSINSWIVRNQGLVLVVLLLLACLLITLLTS